MAEAETIDCIHEGRSARATIATALSAMAQTVTALRKDFKLHLLRADIVCNVFGGDGQHVDAGRERARNSKLTRAGAGPRIPAQIRSGDRASGVSTCKPCGQKASGGGRFDAQRKKLACMNARSIQMNAHRRRSSGDHEGLLLGISIAAVVAQNQTHGIGAVMHVGGRKESRLPDAVAVGTGMIVL